MLVVTTNTIDGGRITRYIDAVCASTVVGKPVTRFDVPHDNI